MRLKSYLKKFMGVNNMREVHPMEIKIFAASANSCPVAKVSCSNCIHWGWNHGGVQYSDFTSRCKVRKEKTVGNQYCRCFRIKN